MMKQIPISTPEQMGVPSAAISRLIKRLEHSDVPMHSLLIARHGAMITEGYYAPYTSHTLHRMFSVTKSLVSLAIGCLEQEGKVKLSDTICSYFPELLPKNIHPWLASMTLRDMLEMKTCYSSTTYSKSGTSQNWVESFFTTKPSHPSGTVFLYDTSSSHTLCALVEKLTGLTLLDYLRNRFLNDIGFSQDAYVMKDPFGVSIGGSGLMALPSDLMRLGLLLMNDGYDPANYGNADAKSLYPFSYLKQALAFHSATIMNAPIKEETCGYGYQFWKISHNGYACYGMGGQLLLCYPDEDLICVTTADTQDIKGGNQLIYDGLYEELFPYLSNVPLPASPTDYQCLTNQLAQLSLPVLNGSMTSPLAESYSGQIYTLEPNEGGFLTMCLRFQSKDQGQLIYSNQNGTHQLPFALGRLADGVFPSYRQRCTTSACWLMPHTLYIRCWLVDECIASVHFQLDFSCGHMTVWMRKTEETKFEEYQGFLNDVGAAAHSQYCDKASAVLPGRRT